MMRYVLFTTVLFLFACGNNNGVNPNDPPTFARDIEPLLNKNCAFSGCHGAQNTNPAGGPLNLTASNGQGYALIVNRASFQMPQLMLVRPSQPDSSYLLKKLRGDSDINGAPMPFGNNPLPQAQIDLITNWISAGALR